MTSVSSPLTMIVFSARLKLAHSRIKAAEAQTRIFIFYPP
jgi:hypothetical protein